MLYDFFTICCMISFTGNIVKKNDEFDESGYKFYIGVKIIIQVEIVYSK